MGCSDLLKRIVAILGVSILASPLFSGPVQIAEEQILARVNEPSPLPQLEILSTPSDAWVYIEGNLAGSTPLTLKELPPSLYRIRVQKSGYRPMPLSVTLKTGIRTRILLELDPIYGTLSLEQVPPECRVYVAGNLVSGKHVSLPVGSYRVVVQRFGYEDIVSQISILEGKTTEIPLNWKRVPFSVSRFTVKPQRINPESRTAAARITFWTSASAETTLCIQDSSGNLVWTKTLPASESPMQQVEWNGRNRDGIPLPDGTYQLILHFKSPDTTMELTREIILDRMTQTPTHSTFSGLSGLLFSPGVSLLDPGSFRISSWILGQSGPSRQDSSPTLVHVGISFPVADGWELSPTLSSFMEATDTPPDWIAGLGAQYRWTHTETILLGFSGKATYMNHPRALGFSQLGGLSLGATLDVRYGFLGFLLSPELTLSPYDLKTLEEQMNLYGSLRGGCYLDLGRIRVGLSSVVSAYIPYLRILPVYHTGVEVHWHPPNLPFIFSFTTLFIQPSEGSLLVYWGAGLGAIY